MTLDPSPGSFEIVGEVPKVPSRKRKSELWNFYQAIHDRASKLPPDTWLMLRFAQSTEVTRFSSHARRWGLTVEVRGLTVYVRSNDGD